MPQLRGAQKIIDNATTDNNGIESNVVNLGQRENLVIMLRNTHNTNGVKVTIEIGASALSAGRNNIPVGTNDPDTGDDDWFPLYDRSGDLFEFTVAGNGKMAIDLSPISAAYLRLRVKSATSDQHANVTAWAQSVG